MHHLKQREIKIYIVSDATGETGEKVILSALSQFKRDTVEINKFIKITSTGQIKEILDKARENNAIVVFTFAQRSLREFIAGESDRIHVVTLDVLGPVFDKFSHYVADIPAEKPGAQHITDYYYYRRIDAIEFTVKHDDGQNLESIYDADIVLVGVSRTSKTPLSIYLAHETWKVANVPFVPVVNYQVDFSRLIGRMVGLIIDPMVLIDIRKERLKQMGGDLSSNYVNLKEIYEEVDLSVAFCKRNKIPVVDVTRKSIEETASEILRTLKKDKRTY